MFRKIFTGRQIIVNRGRVIIDGKDVTPDEKVIHITISGDVNELKVDVCESITVEGNVESLKTISGDVKVKGDVKGDIKTTSGDVDCGNVGGSISTTSGDVKNKK